MVGFYVHIHPIFVEVPDALMTGNLEDKMKRDVILTSAIQKIVPNGKIYPGTVDYSLIETVVKA